MEPPPAVRLYHTGGISVAVWPFLEIRIACPDSDVNLQGSKYSKNLQEALTSDSMAFLGDSSSSLNLGG
jgi:hypothetical protein